MQNEETSQLYSFGRNYALHTGLERFRVNADLFVVSIAIGVHRPRHQCELPVVAQVDRLVVTACRIHQSKRDGCVTILCERVGQFSRQSAYLFCRMLDKRG